MGKYCPMNTIYQPLEDTISRLESVEIPEDRKALLLPIIDYITDKIKSDSVANVNFICTHNSRRSQLSQVWSHMAARRYKLRIGSYSGGVEVTAFNSNASQAVRTAGFEVLMDEDEGSNPTSFVRCNETNTPLPVFSKLYDHEINPRESFAAVMTCSDADENCPFIPGTDMRIPLLYDDPKEFDGTPEQESKYIERSEQIGSELLYAFREVKKSLQ